MHAWICDEIWVAFGGERGDWRFDGRAVLEGRGNCWRGVSDLGDPANGKLRGRIIGGLKVFCCWPMAAVDITSLIAGVSREAGVRISVRQLKIFYQASALDITRLSSTKCKYFL